MARFLALALMLVFILAACGPVVEVPVEVTRLVEVVSEVEVTRLVEVEVTRVVPEIMTVVVFPTDEPATPTAESMPTPEPTSTSTPAPTSPPAPARAYTSGDVIAAFQAAGLEVGATTLLNPNTDPSLTPKTYSEGTRFIIPSLGADLGGRVFSFATEADRDVVTSYYQTVTAAGLGTWYSVNNLLVLQINSDLTQERWFEYESVFQSLR